MKKKFLFLFFTMFMIFIFINAYAQDKNIEEIIKNIEKTFNETRSFSAKFTQETGSKIMGFNDAKGIIYFRSPMYMRWDYSEPEKQHFISNGDKTWLYIPSEKTIYLYDTQKIFSSHLIKGLLSGGLDLKKEFDITLIKQDINSNKILLNMIPKNNSDQVKSLEIWVDPVTYRIFHITAIDMLDNINKITFKELLINQEVDMSIFSYNPGKDVFLQNFSEE